MARSLYGSGPRLRVERNQIGFKQLRAKLGLCACGSMAPWSPGSITPGAPPKSRKRRLIVNERPLPYSSAAVVYMIIYVMYTFAAGLRWLAISCHWNCSVYDLPGVREWLISGHVATQWAKLLGQGFRRQWILLRQAANGQGHICLKPPKWMVQCLDWFKGKS